RGGLPSRDRALRHRAHGGAARPAAHRARCARAPPRGGGVMGLLDPGSTARSWLRGALGAGLGAAARLRGTRAEARIIYYHRIDDEMHRSCVTPAAFRAQMELLRDRGHRVVPLADL